jgi:FkbM family methyltransferase
MKRAAINLVRYQVRQGFLSGLIFLVKFRKKSGLISVKPSNIKFPFWLRAGTSDIPTFDELFVANHYDFNYGFNAKNIIDCGANIGLSTIFFKNLFPDAAIIAIEPEHSNFEMLQKNVTPYNNISCINAGVWNKETNLKGSEKYGTEKWMFSVEEVSNTESEGESKKDLMPAVSIAGLMQTFQLPTIDILKIDIEGAELELFSTNTEYWLPKTKCIVIELHDWLRKGCGTAFFKATSQYNFSYFQKGVNLFCINNSF